MNLHGHRVVDAPAADLYAAIMDPAILLDVIPGCRELERVSPTEYRGRIALRLPGFAGGYETVVRVVESDPPRRGVLAGEVGGGLGRITGEATFRLTGTDAGTAVDYEGEATINGPLARLDARFVEGLAASLIGQGLDALEARLRAAQPRGADPPADPAMTPVAPTKEAVE
jgi:carbon monoxide dehydrogenase subunit G